MQAQTHPLEPFFQQAVRNSYEGKLGLNDPDVTAYVAHLLCEFSESDNLYKVRDQVGRPIEELTEMMEAADPVHGSAPSFDAERALRKHIGDYALFFTGMFPQSLNKHRLRKMRMEAMVDFVKAGKESYYIVSKFEHFEYAKVAPLFRKMSQEFEKLVYGLNQVKNELEELQHPIARQTKEFLM